MNNHRLKSIISDIRFWIILFFIIRLFGITNPPLEAGHNWRQAVTNMVGRNFYQGDANILYPRIDMAGEKSGVMASEFPFFNYLIYLLSEMFGYAHWYGRLINLLASTLGLLFFSKLINGLFNSKIGFASTFILACSIWFAHSRKSMPDVFSVSLVIIGLYFAYRYLMNGKLRSLVTFFFFSTLGILCKIPALSLFSILGITFFIKKVSTKRKMSILISGLITMALVSFWYFYWVPYLLKTYQFQLFFPQSLSEGFRQIVPLWKGLLEKFYFSALNSFIALAGLLLGLIFLLRDKAKRVIISLALVTLVFFIFILKTGYVFPTHSYYVVPFVPVMAFIAGYGISKLPVSVLLFVLFFILAEGIGNNIHDFTIKEELKYKLTLEQIADKHIPTNDLIVINGTANPSDIYFSNRKGWTVENELILKTGYLDSLNQVGADFLILDRHKLDQLMDYRMIYSDKHYNIYNLGKIKEEE